MASPAARTGRSILITGCSSGIGAAAATALRARGWTVVASCRQEADCARLQSEGFRAPRLDYADPASIGTAWADTLEATGGRLDALFNNGAHAVPGFLEDLPPDALRAILEANLIGWHDLTRRALPVMRAQAAGRIVNCSSVLGYVGLRWRGAYVATKFALEGYSDVLRLELSGTGVHVSLIEPGPIATRFRDNAQGQFERWIDWRGSARSAEYAGLLARFESGTPDRWELPPAAVVEALIRALDDPRPRARYRVTTPAQAMALAKRLLPTALLDRLLRRA